MTDTPRTNAIDFGDQNDPMMYSNLWELARKLERELTTEYQRGLNDGLEQAAGICDEQNQYRSMKADEYAIAVDSCAQAIRAQIKK